MAPDIVSCMDIRNALPYFKIPTESQAKLRMGWEPKKTTVCEDGDEQL